MSLVTVRTVLLLYFVEDDVSEVDPEPPAPDRDPPQLAGRRPRGKGQDDVLVVRPVEDGRLLVAGGEELAGERVRQEDAVGAGGAYT